MPCTNLILKNGCMKFCMLFLGLNMNNLLLLQGNDFLFGKKILGICACRR
jgi:hypothetical protein